MPPKVNKIEVELRKLCKLEGNKSCADCTEKMPSYVDLTHNIFVCTKCSGLHRDFQFKVKGISMSVFTEEDVAKLASVGNAAFNSIYLARFTDHKPSGTDIGKLKDHIRLKYVDKKWCDESGSGASDAVLARRPSTSGADKFTIKPLAKGTPGSNSLRRASAGATPTGDSFGMDLLSINDSASATPTKAVQEDPFRSGISKTSATFDPFASPSPATNGAFTNQSADPFSSPSAQSSAIAVQNGPSTGFDPFGSPTAVSTTPVQNPSAFDPFGGASSASTFDAFGTTARSGSAAPVNPSFSAFGTPQPPGYNPSYQQSQFGQNGFFNQSQPVPLPFIKVAPPKPEPVPEPEPVVDTSVDAVTGKAPVTKNFSAFDDLMGPSPVVEPSNAVNPFEAGAPNKQNPSNQGGPTPSHSGAQQALNSNPYGQAPAFQQQYQQGYPPAGYAQPVGQRSNPYGYQQQAYGYPPQQQGYPPQQQGYPPQQQGYPPQQQGYPPQQQGYPPQQQGYQPQHGYNQQPGQPVPQQYEYGQPTPNQGYNQPQGAAGPNVALVEETPAAPDPFAAMSGLAWNALGKAPPARTSSFNAGSKPYVSPSAGSQPAPTINAQQFPSMPPTQSSQAVAPAPPAPTGSVNPFDMF